MSTESATYVGKHFCGGWQVLILDNPQHLKEVAREVGKMLRWGLKVERLLTSEARLSEPCQCKGRARTAREPGYAR